MTTAVVENKTTVIDVDLASYFDTVRHDILLGKVAARVNDDEVLRLLKLILKAGGKRGVPQGGVISPLLSNLYLNEVDKMLERAKAATRRERYHHIEYARYADDLVILIDGYRRWQWLEKAAYKRLLEELAKLDVELNRDKTRCVDLAKGESFSFLGFDIRRSKTRRASGGRDVCRDERHAPNSCVNSRKCFGATARNRLRESLRAHSRFPGHAVTPTGVMAIRCKQFHLPDL